MNIMDAGSLLLVFWLGFTLAMLTTKRRPEAEKADPGVTAQIIEHIDKAPKDALLIVTVPRFLNEEQREAVRAHVTDAVPGARVLIAEGGMTVHVVESERDKVFYVG